MNNIYEPIPQQEPHPPENFYTAPDRTPVPVPTPAANQYEPIPSDNFKATPAPATAPSADSYFDPASKERAVPPPSAPESSQQHSSKSNASQKSQQQPESTDLRSAEKVKSRRVKAKKPAKPSSDEDALMKDKKNMNAKIDPEQQEETTRVTLRLQRFALQQQKQAERIKICIWVTTGIIVIFGFALTAFLLAFYFTECFDSCKGLL